MKKKNQKGSATIVIVIILALGLIGTVSYFAWQKLTANKETVAIETDQSEQTEDDFISNSDIDVHDVNSSDTTTTTNPIPTTNTPAVTNTKTGNENFPITQWGVTGYYNSNLPAEYLINSSQVASFTSSSLTGACAGKSVGLIEQMNGSEVFSRVGGSTDTVSQVFASGHTNVKKIGIKYYVYISPQQACYQTGTTTPDATYLNASDAIHQYFTTLVAI